MSRFQLSALTAPTNSKISLEHAVLQSLLNYAKAQKNDTLDKGQNKQGWWANEFLDGVGCRDWTLARSKQTDETLTRAKIYTEKALQWLIDDKIVKQINVKTYYRDEQLIRTINLTLPSDKKQHFITLI